MPIQLLQPPLLLNVTLHRGAGVVKDLLGRAGQFIVPLLLIALVLAPPASMLWPGTITWATFGFTLYGAIPVPALDVIVNADGILWFREKTHLITLDEVVRITGDGSRVEVLVIGTDDGGIFRGSCELFDPVAETWRAWDIRLRH